MKEGLSRLDHSAPIRIAKTRRTATLLCRLGKVGGCGELAINQLPLPEAKYR
jgi:hypothetical protein